MLRFGGCSRFCREAVRDSEPLCPVLCAAYEPGFAAEAEGEPVRLLSAAPRHRQAQLR